MGLLQPGIVCYKTSIKAIDDDQVITSGDNFYTVQLFPLICTRSGIEEILSVRGAIIIIIIKINEITIFCNCMLGLL